MKKRNIIFMIISLFISIPTVNAELGTITDISPNDYSVTVEAGHSATAELKLTLNHPEIDSNTTIYAYFVKNSSSAKPDLTSLVDKYGAFISGNFGSSFYNGHLFSISSNNQINVTKDWYLAKDYEYVYIICKQKAENNIYNYTITSSPIQVKHPDLPSITDRYEVYLFDNNDYKDLSVFPYFPCRNATNDRYGSHELITKIGKVNDNNILKNIRDAKSGAYYELLTYAKNNQEIKKWTYDDSSSTRMSLKDFTVTNGAYYYIYTTYENSDGLYRDLDGISLVMADHDMITTILTWSSLPDDDTPTEQEPTTEVTPIVEEPIVEDKPVENKNSIQKNPGTGTTIVTISWIIGLAALFVSFSYYKKTELLNNK